jgi:uncharacterized delta-60 repeat protein
VLARYAANGNLDATFGAGGRALPEMPNDREARTSGLARQSSGKLVLTAHVRSAGGVTFFGVLRLNTDGSRDATFGSNGVHLATVPQTSTESSNAIAVQPDDRLVVAGSGCLEPCPSYATRKPRVFVIARYTASGLPDASFGAQLANGFVFTSFGAGISASAVDVGIQSDGRIVAAGSAYSYADETTRLALARYHPDGRLDRSFGGTGKVRTGFASASVSQAFALAIQPDGKLVVAAEATVDLVRYLALVRYRPNGSLDTSFDGDGKVLTRIPGYDASGVALVLQPNGKIVVAGSGQRRGSSTNETRAFLVRYNPNGSLDEGFGQGGRVVTQLDGSSWSGANAAVRQPNGRIVVGGFAQTTSSEYSADFAIARYRG